MYKIFYNPDTLEIKWYSDWDIIMELPYLETDYQIVLFNNYHIVDEEGTLVVKPIKLQYTEEEWNEVTNPIQ